MAMNELLQINKHILNQVYWVLQIAKIHKFFVFLRKMKEKKLRKNYQMNMNHYL